MAWLTDEEIKLLENAYLYLEEDGHGDAAEAVIRALEQLKYLDRTGPSEELCQCGEPLVVTKTCSICDNDE